MFFVTNVTIQIIKNGILNAIGIASISFLILFTLLFPTPVKATELADEFLKRCLFPLVHADPFVSEGLVGPLKLPDANHGIEGVEALRRSWQFSEKNWTLVTIKTSRAHITITRICGITVYGFQGEGHAVLANVLSESGFSSEICQFELNAASMFGFRGVVQKTKRGFPILINFSPLNDGGHVLIAWEIPPDVASSPCGDR